MTDRDEWFFRIKTATRALVKMIGTHEAAAVVAGVSRSAMQRWASTVDADLITLTAAMKLEAECGVPCVTEAMAARHGAHLVAADGLELPACMTSAFMGLSAEFGDVAARMKEAIRKGEMSPNDLQAICDEVHDVSVACNDMKGVSARLRAVGETR